MPRELQVRIHAKAKVASWQVLRQVTFLLLFVTAMCLHADQNLAAPNLSQIASDFQMTPMQKDCLAVVWLAAKSGLFPASEDSRLGGLVQFGFFLVGGARAAVTWKGRA